MEFPTLPSTNLFATELLSKSKPAEGTAISASFQTEGRGQIGSKWHGDPGKNLAVSIILYPFFLKPTQQFFLNQAIALAVLDCLSEALGKPVHVKWPNDVYIGTLKLGGILIQNSISGTALQSSVAGIGINVNQDHFDESLPNPTSLKLEADGREFDLEVLMNQLFMHVEQRYLQLKSGYTEALNSAYREWLYGLETPRFFKKKDGSVFQGSITGTTKTGMLCIRDEQGAESTFDLKDIQFIH